MTKNHCYLWSGITSKHKKISGEIFATSVNFARVYLLQKNIQPISIRKKPFYFFKFISKKITTHELAVFFRQLATLITAGTPIIQSCESLMHSQEKPLLKKIILNIQHDIEAGYGFIQSLRNFPEHFSELTCHLLETGEKSGTLDIMLNRVAFHYEKMLRLKRQLKQALLYPSIIFTIAIVVTFIMLIFIVPRFQNLFANTQTSLPAFTQAIISFSTFLRNYSKPIFLSILCACITAYFVKPPAKTKILFDSFLLKIPWLRNLLQKTILARFSRNLSTLFVAGIPIIDALKMTASITNNHHYTQAILHTQTTVATGQQLHLAMKQNKLFPPLMLQMIKTGEESGSLDQMLEKIAEFYEDEVDHFIAQMSQMLEPLIMVVLGVLIGGLVIAMYLPIFKLGTII